MKRRTPEEAYIESCTTLDIKPDNIEWHCQHLAVSDMLFRDDYLRIPGDVSALSATAVNTVTLSSYDFASYLNIQGVLIQQEATCSSQLCTAVYDTLEENGLYLDITGTAVSAEEDCLCFTETGATSHYQGTPYDPLSTGADILSGYSWNSHWDFSKGFYRPGAGGADGEYIQSLEGHAQYFSVRIVTPRGALPYLEVYDGAQPLGETCGPVVYANLGQPRIVECLRKQETITGSLSGYTKAIILDPYDSTGAMIPTIRVVELSVMVDHLKTDPYSVLLARSYNGTVYQEHFGAVYINRWNGYTGFFKLWQNPEYPSKVRVCNGYEEQDERDVSDTPCGYVQTISQLIHVPSTEFTIPNPNGNNTVYLRMDGIGVNPTATLVIATALPDDSSTRIVYRALGTINNGVLTQTSEIYDILEFEFSYTYGQYPCRVAAVEDGVGNYTKVTVLDPNQWHSDIDDFPTTSGVIHVGSFVEPIPIQTIDVSDTDTVVYLRVNRYNPTEPPELCAASTMPTASADRNAYACVQIATLAFSASGRIKNITQTTVGTISAVLYNPFVILNSSTYDSDTGRVQDMRITVLPGPVTFYNSATFVSKTDLNLTFEEVAERPTVWVVADLSDDLSAYIAVSTENPANGSDTLAATAIGYVYQIRDNQDRVSDLGISGSFSGAAINIGNRWW